MKTRQPLVLKTIKPGYRFIATHRGSYAVWEVVNQTDKERWNCCIACIGGMELDVGATRSFSYEEISEAKRY